MAKVAMSYKWCSEGIAYWFLTETEKYVMHIIICLQNLNICPFPIKNELKLPKMVYIIPNTLVW